MRGWRTGGGVPREWGWRGEERYGGEGEAVVVSGSLRLTGDITLRHGWRDRGTEGAMVIQAEKCQRPDTAVTHTHTYTQTRGCTGTQVHKDPGQRSLESLRAKKAGYSGQR